MQRQSLRELPANTSPTGTRCIQITIPDDDEWEQDLFGEIYRLALWMLWERDLAKSGKPVADQWRAALDTWTHCKSGQSISIGTSGDEDFMIRQNPDNPCLLESSVDGITWCQWGDLSKCIAGGMQPGSGSPTPTPGGGSACYQAKLLASGKFFVPAAVNAGDVIELTGATGAGTDPTFDVAKWRCPNGEQFFGGACVGFNVFDGADPLTAVSHMRLVMSIGGTFYDAMDGPVTVPGGVVNAPVVIQVNDSTLNDNSGDYTFQVCVTNNQAVAWSHVLDFTLSPFGFHVLSDGFFVNLGQWTAGQGFSTDAQIVSGTYYRAAALQLTPAHPVRLTHVAILYNLTVGNIASGGPGTFLVDDVGVNASVNWVSEVTANGQSLGWTGDHPGLTHLDVFVGASTQPGSYSTGDALVYQMTIAGIGYDPFA